jgi:hypothetical protein
MAIYCGSAKVRQTKWGDQYELRMFRDEIERLTTYLDDQGMRSVRVDVCAKREAKDDWTHFLKINEWRPSADLDAESERQAANRADTEPTQRPLPPVDPDADDDIPF